MLRRSAIVLTLLAAACSEPGATRPTAEAARRASSIAADDPTLAWLEGYLASPHAPAAPEPAVLAGAGDIARCYAGSDIRSYRRPGPSNPAEQTARLLDGM